MLPNTDFLILGAGVIGLSIAREVRRHHPDCSVMVIDKEDGPGRHASGRNSGVLHAGFYYTADSLKARFTRAGNVAWTDYCRERRLPLRSCGKLVVASTPDQTAALDVLLARGKANGVPVDLVDAKAARDIEPRARTVERALFSPSTSVVDPQACMASLARDAEAEGVTIKYACGYVGRSGGKISTTAGPIEAGFVVNSAGLQADRVASDFGFGRRYRILPFKGLYLYSDEAPESFRTHIYPVPDLRNPFLGVHVTVTVDGRAKIGPTAIPALWRENYDGFANFSATELGEILLRQASLLLTADFDFRRLAIEEIQKNSRKVMVSLAARLAEGISVEHYKRWGKPGIRAQLLDIEKRSLVMDFVLEGDKRSMHILNAVSPGFTCAFPFASYVVDRIASSL